VPDVGPILHQLLENDGAYGRAWHLGGAGRITEAELIRIVEELTSRKLTKIVIGKRGLQFLGLFNPLLREVADMHYLQTHPLFLNDDALRALIGPFRKTTYEEGVKASLGFRAKAQS
jgi:nucleoside-diphosphate-sugar epimerase